MDRIAYALLTCNVRGDFPPAPAAASTAYLRSTKELASKVPGESSAEVREKLIISRRPQAKRFGRERSIYNGNLCSRQIA